MRFLATLTLAASMSAFLVACDSTSPENGMAQVASRGGNHGGGNKPLCTGNEPPRQGAAYTANASLYAKLDAYQALNAQYAVEHPEAAEYADVSSRLSGSSCFTDSDCATGDETKFHGTCQRYEWDGTNGSCNIATAIQIPTPPAQPRFTCEDVTCPSQFQCEVEESTGAVGCVEQRLCREP